MKNKSGHNLKQNDLLFLQARVNGLVLKGAAVERSERVKSNTRLANYEPVSRRRGELELPTPI